MSGKTAIAGFRSFYNALVEAECTSKEASSRFRESLADEFEDELSIKRVLAVIAPSVSDRVRKIVERMQDGQVITYGTLAEATGTTPRGATSIITGFGTEPRHAAIVLHKADKSGQFVERDDVLFSYYDEDTGERLGEFVQMKRSAVLSKRGVPFTKVDDEVIAVDPERVHVLTVEEARSLLFV